MPTRSMRNKVPSRITNALRAATAIACSKVGAIAASSSSASRTYRYRRGADPEAAGQIRIGLPLTEISDHQHRLATYRQLAPAGGPLAAVAAQQVKHDRERASGHAHP